MRGRRRDRCGSRGRRRCRELWAGTADARPVPASARRRRRTRSRPGSTARPDAASLRTATPGPAAALREAAAALGQVGAVDGSVRSGPGSGPAPMRRPSSRPGRRTHARRPRRLPSARRREPRHPRSPSPHAGTHWPPSTASAVRSPSPRLRRPLPPAGSPGHRHRRRLLRPAPGRPPLVPGPHPPPPRHQRHRHPHHAHPRPGRAARLPPHRPESGQGGDAERARPASSARSAEGGGAT